MSSRQFFQYRGKILRRLSVPYRMIENIENIHQFTVVFIDLVDVDTQNLVPNDIFHQPSPVGIHDARVVAQENDSDVRPYGVLLLWYGTRCFGGMRRGRPTSTNVRLEVRCLPHPPGGADSAACTGQDVCVPVDGVLLPFYVRLGR